jgi:hypothetical protein
MVKNDMGSSISNISIINFLSRRYDKKKIIYAKFEEN